MTYPIVKKCERRCQNILPGKKGTVSIPIEERFWPRVQKTETCWIWTGAKNPLGYGQIYWNGRKRQAYAVAYELTNGPVPSHLELDHLCRNPSCVNPAHLEPVTHQENMRRSVIALAKPTPYRTRCRNGHELTAENTYQHGKYRFCVECRRANTRRYGKKRRAALSNLREGQEGKQ